MADTRFIEDTYGNRINFTVKKSDGTAYDLTDATITFIMEARASDTAKITGSCTISDATGGLCYYVTESADMDTVGSYVGYLTVVKTGVSLKSTKFRISVYKH